MNKISWCDKANSQGTKIIGSTLNIDGVYANILLNSISGTYVFFSSDLGIMPSKPIDLETVDLEAAKNSSNDLITNRLNTLFNAMLYIER
jgi:hypothetical protein